MIPCFAAGKKLLAADRAPQQGIIKRKRQDGVDANNEDCQSATSRDTGPRVWVEGTHVCAGYL